MFNRNKRKRGLFAAMSLTLVAALGFAGAPSAMADTPQYGNMPTNGQGTITIHKYDSAQGKVANHNGNEQTGITNTPLKGVTFTITKITDFDINTPANWTDLAKLNGHALKVAGDKLSADGVAGVEFTLAGQPADTLVTETDGSKTSKALDFGAYLVQETDKGDNAITKKADPFVVTLPLPNDTNGKWLTDVHVYPKNDINKPGTKEVSNVTDLKKVGDNIVWTITTTAGKNPVRFGVVDKLEDYLSFKGTVEVKFNGQVIDASHYEVTSTPKQGATKGTVKIEFKKANLDDIAAGGDVQFKITTTLNSLPDNGKVENHGFPINNEYDPFSEDPENPPIDVPNPPYYGEYKFTKVDAGNQKPLKDAEFAICAEGTSFEDCTGDAIIATATSGDDGVVDFAGIYLGLADPGKPGKNFVLKEISTPAGYVLPTDVTAIQIPAGKMDTSAQNVENTRQTGPDLPMTGAAGMVLLTLAGVAVFAIATGLGFVNKRRKNA